MRAGPPRCPARRRVAERRPSYSGACFLRMSYLAAESAALAAGAAVLVLAVGPSAQDLDLLRAGVDLLDFRGGSVRSPAARFSFRRCSLCVPEMGTIQGFFASSQASATWAGVASFVAGDLLVQVHYRMVRLEGFLSEAGEAASDVLVGERLAGADLACEETLSQRAPGNEADTQFLTSRISSSGSRAQIECSLCTAAIRYTACTRRQTVDQPLSTGSMNWCWGQATSAGSWNAPPNCRTRYRRGRAPGSGVT